MPIEEVKPNELRYLSYFIKQILPIFCLLFNMFETCSYKEEIRDDFNEFEKNVQTVLEQLIDFKPFKTLATNLKNSEKII
jgi:hypothetical protein